MENQPSIAQIALKWGILTGLACIVYSTLLVLTNLNMNQGVSSLIYVILVGGLFFSIKDFRTQNGSYVLFGQGLGVGSLVGALAGLLSGAFTFIYMKFVDATLSEQIMEKTREQYEKAGMGEEQIAKALEIAKLFMTPGAIFMMTFLMFLIIGFIASLVMAAVLKKEDNFSK